jgi:hypothetical protein
LAAAKTMLELNQVEMKKLREEMNELKERQISLTAEEQSEQKSKAEELLLEYESVDPVRTHICDDEWKVVSVDDTVE